MKTLIVLLATATLALAKERPNVILIMTDDHGYGDIGAHGHPHLRHRIWTVSTAKA